MDDPEVVLEAAAAFLAVRPRSVAETRRRLRSLGYRDGLVELVLARLIAFGYLDDAAFGRAWLESRDRAHPRGEVALRRELALKGVDRDTIESLLEQRAEASMPADALRGGGEPNGQWTPDGSAAPSAPTGPTEPIELVEPDLRAAIHLLERRRRSLEREPDPRRRRERAYALLARNGFDPDTIREAILRRPPGQP